MTATHNSTLFEQVMERNNLFAAWQQVKENDGAPGIDGITIQAFPEYTRTQAKGIFEAIRQGHYAPYPVRSVTIEKEHGDGVRTLGIPTVLDRVIQQAIAQQLSPDYETIFSDYSYGYRPGRSQHQAIRQVQQYVAQGYKIAVEVDISKFFDRVNHDLLMSLLGQRIRDKSVLKLIGQFLRAGKVDNGVWYETREGVPQGGPLSPLLSNILLDVLDKELEKRNHRFARYADDILILVKSKRAGNRVLASITRFIERKLKLTVNELKSKVVPVSQCRFLGFTFHGKQIKWHESALKKFKRKVKEHTGRSKGISMEKRIENLSNYLRGWINYFGIAQGYQRCIELDGWIRRRLRMCYWKQWRRVGTRIKNLLNRGVYQRLAVCCGMSSKGYWHSSRTEGINRALPDKLFEELGLISLRDRWVELHYG